MLFSSLSLLDCSTALHRTARHGTAQKLVYAYKNLQSHGQCSAHLRIKDSHENARNNFLSSHAHSFSETLCLSMRNKSQCTKLASADRELQEIIFCATLTCLCSALVRIKCSSNLCQLSAQLASLSVTLCFEEHYVLLPLILKRQGPGSDHGRALPLPGPHCFLRLPS